MFPAADPVISVDPRLVEVPEPAPHEGLFGYLQRTRQTDANAHRRLIGAANAFKEGDASIGVGAANEQSRTHARRLLANTQVGALHDHPLFPDQLETLIRRSLYAPASALVRTWSLASLKAFLLSESEHDIKVIMPGLHSDVIAAVVKIMSNDELVTVSRKIFNPLPGSRVGARGYMGARLQPNSPTDNVEDIRWQVFNGFAFATGDVLLGTNPVDGRVDSVARIERALRGIVETFGLSDILPWCVLAHVDTQAAVAATNPDDVALMFQSLAGNDAANQTFGISVAKMLAHNHAKSGPFGFYYETGQGADFTNGAHYGTDMVVHEARKYGFARALNGVLGQRLQREVWTIVNDVAGFIGPEVFRTGEQLVRCCLEDLVMGKLHGLCIGHDVCATLHMSVGLDDLTWCLEQIMPANPAFLMALPTRNDPMLSYLTTAFQDHVRLRERFGYKINDAMAAFFYRIGILDAAGHFTAHAGDPFWVYYQYCRAQGDQRSAEAIMREGRTQAEAVQSRGVPLAIGHGEHVGDMVDTLEAEVQTLYNDAKACLWTELTPSFTAALPAHLVIHTRAESRAEYIARPTAGEMLSRAGRQALEALRQSFGSTNIDVQIAISDGLNAAAIMDDGHLAPLLERLASRLAAQGLAVSPQLVVIPQGRVRAGYAAGKTLFAEPKASARRILIHVIGERPGTTHHNYSVYVAALSAAEWAADRCDHDVVRVVSGISDTALAPHDAADIIADLLEA